MFRFTFLLLLFFTLNNCLAQRFKDKVLLSGDDFFQSFVYVGGNPKAHDMSSLKKVFAFDSVTKRFEPIIENLKGNCYKVSSSPGGDKLAILIGTKNQNEEFGRDVLQIFDEAGRVLIEINDVYGFVWLPTKDSILYLSGRYSEMNEIGGFAPTGTWILDIKNNSKEKIYKEGYSLFFDGRTSTIFIDTYQKVVLYNISSKKLEETNLHGNQFSPNGKYYYRDRSVYRPFMLYETVSNQPVKIPGIDSSTQCAMWLGGKGDNLIVGDYDGEKKIINIETGSVKKSFTGRMIGYNPKTSEIYVHKDKKVFKKLTSSKIERIKIDQ